MNKEKKIAQSVARLLRIKINKEYSEMPVEERAEKALEIFKLMIETVAYVANKKTG